MTAQFTDTIPGTAVTRGLAKDDLIVIAGRRRLHRRLPHPVLRRAGLHQHPGHRPQAAPRLVPARPGRRVHLDGPLSHEQNAIEAVTRRRGGLQPRGRHGRHGLHRELPRRVPAQHPRQHAPDRGVLSRRRLALLLLLVGLRLQHGPPEVARGHRAQGVRRLPGDGRARLRLGEAHLRDVLPGVLGGARARDPHRALPQHLRPERHLVRRPREGARGDVAQGARGASTPATCGSRSGATAPRRARSATSTTASTAST